MTRITNSDQIFVLLRAYLQRGERATTKGQPAPSEKTTSTPLSRAKRLAMAEDLSEGETERALVAGLLAEEFGEGFANEARFQVLVTDVLQIIRSDEAARQVMLMALARLTD
jgi:hypothetical protein